MEKNKNNDKKNELKKDCLFYQKNKCYALEEFVCENKKCTFYKPNKRLNML